MGILGNLPPIFWVGVGIVILIGAFKDNDGDTWGRLGCALILIFGIVAMLVVFDVGGASDLLRWLLEPPL